MKIKTIDRKFTVCKVESENNIDMSREFCFAGKTDEEISLVCDSEFVPAETIEREDGWRAFRIEGVLDFSLIGILAKIANLLADSGISIFAVSTYNTDYIMIKEEKWDKAIRVLENAGYEVS